MKQTKLSKPTEAPFFGVAPPPPSQSDIKKVVNADVVVAGGGLSGMCAAISAAEAGARVVLLEKGDTFQTRGHANAAIGSKLQKERGIEIDRDGIINEIMRWGGFRSDQKLISFWVDNCGKAMDWLLDMVPAVGATVNTMEKTQADLPGYFQGFGVIHEFFPDGQLTLQTLLESKLREVGVDIHFLTPAVNLIREENGRVTGIIAQNNDDYFQFNARAVVLCTGGYEHNRKMLEKFAPDALKALNHAYQPPLTTGDGHKMATWIGAAMEDTPHCCVFEDGGGEHLEAPWTHAGIGMPRLPWLNVNLFGERFFKEDSNFTFVCNAEMALPDRSSWVIWDGKWEEETKRLNRYQGVNGRHVYSSFHRTTPELYQEKIDNGAIIKVDTLEELAHRMEIPFPKLMATINRYNELCRLGKDLDFGKNPKLLTAVEKAPFFAAKTGAALLVTLGGLKINTKLQVLDENNDIIPGLYAAGNVSGGFFAKDYPCIIPGLTHGRAFTFGYFAGLNAASERIEHSSI